MCSFRHHLDVLFIAAFIITGGCGALGGGVAREILSRGGIVVIFDVLTEEKGKEIVEGYSKDKAFYYKTDISDVDVVSRNCEEALKVIPKGSLFGAVHCAAISRSRKWSAKMADSCKDFLEISKTNIYGTFVSAKCRSPVVSLLIVIITNRSSMRASPMLSIPSIPQRKVMPSLLVCPKSEGSSSTLPLRSPTLSQRDA
jgi:NAD(P)-dependent dehydrogenase (short-subunit alcohol dehydrogenase family)